VKHTAVFLRITQGGSITYNINWQFYVQKSVEILPVTQCASFMFNTD